MTLSSGASISYNQYPPFDMSQSMNNRFRHGAIQIGTLATSGTIELDSGSSISYNAGGSGGALEIGSLHGSLTVRGGSSLDHNTAPTSGGAISIGTHNGSLSVMEGSSMSYNRAYGSGGAIAVTDITNSFNGESNGGACSWGPSTSQMGVHVVGGHPPVTWGCMWLGAIHQSNGGACSWGPSTSQMGVHVAGGHPPVKWGCM
jgi:predicted outer membrane repeat protein